MRKICLFICSLMLLALLGCENNSVQAPENKAYVNNQTTVAQVLADQTAQAPVSNTTSMQTAISNTTSQNIQAPLANPNVQSSTTSAPAPTSNETDNEDLLGKDIASSDNQINYDKIDVDLSTMSSSLIYSEVLNIMTEPENYCGKVIKMSGSFTAVVDDDDGKTYTACIIQDATACCAQGIEFQPYKSDLNNENVNNLIGKNVTVVGTFDKYNIGQNSYYTLKDARILELN